MDLVCGAVGLGVIGRVVVRDREIQEHPLRHGGKDHQTAAGGGVAAGGEGHDLVALGGFLVIEGGVLLEPGAQLIQVPASRAVDHGLIGVGIQDGEEVQVIDSVVGNDLAGAVAVEIGLRLKVVQGAEHDAVGHVVAVDQVIAVAEIAAVVGCQIDGAGEAGFAVDIVAGIEEVVLALDHGIVDLRVIDGEPAAVVGRDGGDGLGQRRAVLHDDLLQHIPAVAGTGHGVGGIIQGIAAVQNEERGQQFG